MVNQYTAAIVQAGSKMMDKDKSVDKAIFYAELDLDKIPEAQFDFDPVGHHARKNIFKLEVDETKSE